MSRIHDLLGIDDLEKIEICLDRENCCFINQETKEKTSFGNFTVMSIKELRDSVSKQNGGKYNGETVSEQKEETTMERKNNNIKIQVLICVDIADLQGKMKTGERCMVQVASNFNCLEMPNRHPISKTKLLSHLHLDYTQGPAATFGTFASSVYRACCYIPPLHLERNNLKEINLLEDVKEYFSTPVNGKVTLTGVEKPVDDDNMEFLVEKIKVGIHTGCAVQYDRSNTYDPPYELVDQFFCSSLNLSSYGKRVSVEEERRICTVFLRAAYEGIYLACILNSNENLYLTLVGGGSFNNDIHLIIQEIKAAHEKYSAFSKLKNVYICLYTMDSVVQNAFP